MKDIMIVTSLYLHELTDFYLCDIPERIISHDTEGEYHRFRIVYKQIDPEQLTEFMEDTVLDQNSVVNNSLKLHNLVKKLVFAKEEHEKIKMDVTNHIKANRQINIDGYINFRMREYFHLTDEILYATVKRNLSTRI